MSANTKIDQRVLDCVSQALNTAFSIQLGVPLRVEAVSTGNASNDIAAVLSLMAPNQRGSLAILLPKEVFLRIFDKMLGEKPLEITDENADAAAEILNIVFGLARKPINLLGYEFQPAIPSVIRGQEIHITHSSGSEVAIFDCQCELGQFNVELSLKKVA